MEITDVESPSNLPLSIDQRIWINTDGTKICPENKPQLALNAIRILNSPTLDRGIGLDALSKANSLVERLKPQLRNLMRNTADYMRISVEATEKRFLRIPRDIGEEYTVQATPAINEISEYLCMLEKNLRSSRHTELSILMNEQLATCECDGLALSIALKRHISLTLSPMLPTSATGIDPLNPLPKKAKIDTASPRHLSKEELLDYLALDSKSFVMLIENPGSFAGKKGNKIQSLEAQWGINLRIIGRRKEAPRECSLKISRKETLKEILLNEAFIRAAAPSGTLYIKTSKSSSFLPWTMNRISEIDDFVASLWY